MEFLDTCLEMPLLEFSSTDVSCASRNFSAQASFRIRPTCMSIGESTGIAANFALKNNIEPNMVEWDQIPENIRSYISA